MNKLLNILIAAPLLVFIMYTSSCDTIENPQVPTYGDLDTSLYPGPGFYVFPEFAETYPSVIENILIEDYTGHTCGNCPSAAIIAHDLKTSHNGRVIIASVHASPGSGFQDVNEPGDPDYPEYSHDFRTPAGEDYVSDIDGFIGNPMGMVNRKLDATGSNWKFTPSWAAAVEDIITTNAPLEMNIQVKLNYYTETRGLFIHVQSKSLQQMDGRYTMVVFLIQEEYIAWQTDYSQPAGQQDVEFYHHKDVLLGAINGSYGTLLFDGASQSDEIFENHFSYEIPEEVEIIGSNPDEASGLSIIAYLMDRDSYEIVQVIEEEVKITY